MDENTVKVFSSIDYQAYLNENDKKDKYHKTVIHSGFPGSTVHVLHDPFSSY